MTETETPFQHCCEHSTSKRAQQLVELIKYEIFPKLPRLEEKEKFLLNRLNDETASDKDFESFSDSSSQHPKMLCKEFYSNLRETYSNFLELKYLDDDMLTELYKLYYFWDENKDFICNSKFNYAFFLRKLIEKFITNNIFDTKFAKAFRFLKSKAIENEEPYWLNASFDCKFANSRESSLNDLTKYYKEIENVKSVIISVDLYYSLLIDDVYDLLITKPYINRLILKVDQKSFWIGDNVEPMPFFDEEEWDKEMNTLMNVVLVCLYRLESLKCLSIVCEKECSFKLSKENCQIMAKMMRKHSQTIEVFTLCRIELAEEEQENIMEALKECTQIKFGLLKGAKLKGSLIEKAIVDFRKEVYKLIYLKFSKKYFVFDNVN